MMIASQTTMFKAVIATLIGSAAAFAPASRVGRSSALKMGFETEVGAQPPLGFFDPLGLLKEADQGRFERLRFVELKHGRVAMLAVVGHLTTSLGVRLPGVIDVAGDKFTDYPAGLAALATIPTFGLIQLILSIGWWDLKVWKQVEGSTPGDFGIPYLAQYKTEAEKTDIRAKELNQGRAAMMGIFALMIHEGLNNDPYVINSLIGVPIPFNVGVDSSTFHLWN
jgi:Chlorophyll A-B binding protein